MSPNRSLVGWYAVVLVGLLWWAAPTRAQQAHDASTTAQTEHWRQIDSTDIAKYRNDAAFDYGNQMQETRGLGYWLRYFLGRMLNAIFSNKGAAPYIRYGIALLVVIGVAYLLYKRELMGLWQRSGGSRKLEFADLANDIYQPNLHERLQQAIAHGAFREAVRVHFLIVLRALSDKELIAWTLEKTNRHYLRELKSSELREAFAQVARYFELIWYGEHELDAAEYERLKESFERTLKLI